MTHRLLVEAPGDPSTARFLHVLEGTDAGAEATTASLVQSDSGVAYSGLLLGRVAVLFPVTLGGPFTGTTYVVPATTRTQLVTGLEPGAGYTVSGAPVAVGTRVTVSPGGTRLAGPGGVLVVGEEPGSGIFADGFENGSTTAWSQAAP